MGTNFTDDRREAHRCLHFDGKLHLWEPANDFDDPPARRASVPHRAPLSPRTPPSLRYTPRVLLTVATALFAANCALGLAAQFASLHLGWLHHAAYALVFASALACLVFAFHPALVVVVLALAVFPRARPRTWQHPALAALCALGYVAAWSW